LKIIVPLLWLLVTSSIYKEYEMTMSSLLSAVFTVIFTLKTLYNFCQDE